MKNTKKKLNSQTIVVKSSFTGSNITRYAGLNTVTKYMNRQNIVQTISSSFLTVWYNATKSGINPVKSALQNILFHRLNQILMAVTLASISGKSRICKIAAFSRDGLAKHC